MPELTQSSSSFDAIPNHYLRVLLPALEAAGQSVPEVLASLDIPLDACTEEGEQATQRQFVDLIQRCWELSGDEFLFRTGSNCSPGLFALMVRYINQFDTLQAGLKELVRFYSTTRNDLLVGVNVDDDYAHLRIDIKNPEHDPDHFMAEFFLTTFHRVLCWLTDTKIFLHHVSFSYVRPDHAVIYERFFNCELIFDGQASILSFPKKYLSLPLIRSKEELREFLKTAPATLMLLPGTDDSFATRIKGFVLHQQRAGRGMPDFAAVASELCMSQQTLRRKLQAEQTSYQQIKDVLRRDIAIDKLVNENLSVAEVAELLGFVEPASFTRAFKHWTGVSPAVYRQKSTSKK